MVDKITHKPAWLGKSPPKPKIRKVQGGAEYEDVASRVQRFRHDHPFGGIETVIVHLEDGRIKATARVFGDPILCGDRYLLATGTACEVRTQRGVNSTSAEENGETSAVGRALALAGYDSTGNIASAEEVDNAIQQQKQPSKKPAAAPSHQPQEKPVASRSGVQTNPEQTPPAAVEVAGRLYGDPGKQGTDRGLDNFVVTQVEVFREGEKNGKTWRIWNINCACGTTFSTFHDEWADVAKDALQADGDVEIGWTRNEKGYAQLCGPWQTRKFMIDGVSAGEHDHVKVIARPSLADETETAVAQVEESEEVVDDLPF